MSDLTFDNVDFAIVTALPDEYAACRMMFDPSLSGVERQSGSRLNTSVHLCTIPNSFGGIHTVAITQLLDAGNNFSAVAASDIVNCCGNLRGVIMCGIAGAVPSPTKPEHHVRLGDIVVSDRNGVIQTDRGKQRDPDPQPRSNTGFFQRLLQFLPTNIVPTQAHLEDPFAGFEFRPAPRPPGPELSYAVSRIQSDEATLALKSPRDWEVLTEEFLLKVGNPDKWERPNDAFDLLEDKKGAIDRHPKDDRRRSGCPRVFSGPIGAANIVLGDSRRRDALRDKFGIKAVEMEGSGIADTTWVANVGYLIIRGTCDYCNPLKGDAWHKYAALIASAYTRVLLNKVPSAHPRRRLPTSIADSTPPALPSGDLASASTSRKAEVELPQRPQQPLVRQLVGNGSDPKASTEQELFQLRLKSIEDATSVVQELNKNGANIESLRPHCLYLEQQLRSFPRKGAAALMGWTALRQVESRTLLERRQLGRPIDLTRSQYLESECERCLTTE